jgi:cell division protein FtsB
MANTPRPQMLEGQSTHRPPLFIGSDYGYWKNRMIMYIKGQDYHVWKIIANGPHIPTKTVEGATLAKLESEWNEADVRLIELNCKAMSTLYCALDPIEYNRVSGCDSAKEIWDKLEVTYEGTNQVKESKMNMLVHEYELFVMKKDENISEMSTRFTNIVNSLKALGKIYTNQENVRKILRSLPKRWEAKMTAISEARDLKVLTLEELFGSLMTYELEMNSKVEEEEVKPKKNFTLKSSHHDHDNSEEERDEEEEIALMTRNFKKFLKKKKGFGRRFPKKGENKGESSKTETPTCYKCKKQGHYKNECPQVNKEKVKYKKKALKVTWDDSDESDSDNNSSDNEVANLCLLGYINESNISEDEHASFCPLAFNDDESATEDLCLMAHGDEVTSKLNSLDDESYSYDELQNAFEELVEEFEKNVLKNKAFKKKVTSLSNELNDLKKKNEILEKQINSLNDKNLFLEEEIIKLEVKSQNFIEKMKANDVETSSQIVHNSNLLINENKELKLKVENLTKILTNFTNGKKNLDNLLGSQRCVFDKAGIGYNPKIKEKHYQKFFINENLLKSPICKHCGKIGHNIHTCPMKIMIWIIKGTSPPTNLRGPKKIWVPKRVT